MYYITIEWGQVALIALFAYWFAAESGIPGYVKGVLWRFGVKKKVFNPAGTNTDPFMYVHVRLLPFDCEKCLAFWIGLVWFWSMPWYSLIASAAICSLVAIVVTRLAARIK